MAKMDDDFVRALEARDAPGRRPGHRHRPALHAPAGPAEHPRRDPVPADAARAASVGCVQRRRRRTAEPEPPTQFHGRRVDVYKYLLCWRYLRTRYIALASMVSVMLGVATMIVVNSVMAGFSEKMRDRLHGVLADVIVESYDLDGFCNSDEVMARIKRGRRRGGRGDGPDHGDLRPDEVPGRRPVDHPAGAAHRHPAPRSGPRPATSPSSSSTTQGQARSRPRSRSPRGSS